MSGSPFDLRPDIVCIGERSAVIIDITIPFEWSVEALHAAREEKVSKYAPLAAWLKADRDLAEVSVEVLVVGALGPQECGGSQGPPHRQKLQCAIQETLLH